MDFSEAPLDEPDFLAHGNDPDRSLSALTRSAILKTIDANEDVVPATPIK
jgi:hypothetical protein